MNKITEIIYDENLVKEFPVNPLEDKWFKMFPKMGICNAMQEFNLVIYGCINCDKCPDGDLWKVPKEDLQAYKKYLEKVKKFDEKHNTVFAKKLSYKAPKDNN